MAIYYKDRHERQSVRLEGPDLLGRRRQEIMAHAEKITCDLIQDFGDLAHFHVASLSCPGEFHVVDLGWIRCNCEDYPQILFCRHITAIYLHFPHLNPENRKSTLMYAPESAQQAAPPQHASKGGGFLQSLTQDIFSLSQALTSRHTDITNPAVVEAFWSVKYSLATAIASMEEKRALPEKDVIAPNQRSWPETAKRMGTRNAPRCQCLPDEQGLTERSVGAIKGKHKHLHEDPYAGGKCSGKHAKLDARSQAANARTCMDVPPLDAPFPEVPECAFP